MLVLLAAKYLTIVFGFVLLFLVWWLPNHIEYMRTHGGAEFGPGFQSLREALQSLMTAFSILAAVAAAFVILPLHEIKSTPSVMLGVITCSIFSAGILKSVYLSLIRPLSGIAPSLQSVYWPLRLLLLGLSFMMFTLASTI